MEHRRPGTRDDEEHPLWTQQVRHRLALAATILLGLVLLLVVPPLIGISRYQRRVASSISESLGRPVHFDTITMHVLPWPGLTIGNFVVDEQKSFGSEPVLRATSVEARLRVGSLWRRRIEVSHITLDAPSINLVRRPDGSGWNLGSILMQAAQMNSAPTAQPRASSAPRFPYIEATDARLNIKNGDDKLPFSIKEAEFALWLPEPDRWHLRLSGKPVRTDTDVSDVGLLHVDATLGRAADLASVPIDLQANWKPTPMGEASKLTVGYDAGWRGEASGSATLKGLLGSAHVTADLHLSRLRRADFVPDTTPEINAHCEATEASMMRALHDIRCAVPTREDTSLFSAIDFLRSMPASTPEGDGSTPDSTGKPGVLLLRGELPSTSNWRTGTLQLSLTGAEPGYALAWGRLFSRRIPPLDVTGRLDLSVATAPSAEFGNQLSASAVCSCTLPSAAASSSTAAGRNHWTVTAHLETAPEHPSNAPHAVSILAFPSPVPADAPRQTEPVDETAGLLTAPAGLVIHGEVSRLASAMVYGSPSALAQAAAILPPLADNAPADATGPEQASRPWGAEPVWAAATPVRPETRRR